MSQYHAASNYVAQSYGSGAYNSSTYQNGTTTASTAPGPNNSSGTTGSTLTNTGFDIALIVTIACTVIFVALVVRFWKRPTAK